MPILPYSPGLRNQSNSRKEPSSLPPRRLHSGPAVFFSSACVSRSLQPSLCGRYGGGSEAQIIRRNAPQRAPLRLASTPLLRFLFSFLPAQRGSTRCIGALQRGPYLSLARLGHGRIPMAGLPSAIIPTPICPIPFAAEALLAEMNCAPQFGIISPLPRSFHVPFLPRRPSLPPYLSPGKAIRPISTHGERKSCRARKERCRERIGSGVAAA